MYTVWAYFGSELESYGLWYYSTAPDESIYQIVDIYV